jgi:hypothetical protein
MGVTGKQIIKRNANRRGSSNIVDIVIGIAPSLLDTFQPYKMAIGEVFMSNKRYTEEFKIEAVRQVIDRGYSVASVTCLMGGRLI